MGMDNPLAGTHFFRVRITNDGTTPFTVNGITLQLSGGSEIEIMNGSQNFNDTIGPGETLPFDMTVDVQVPRAPGGNMLTGSINSIRVVVSATSSEGGSFFESGDYQVGAELGG